MTDPMTPEELRACRERAEAATAGPWCNRRTKYRVEAALAVPVATTTQPSLRAAISDAAFIAHAREDVPRLLATIAALQARTEKAEERDEQIARLKDALVANAVGARAATHARDSAACELDDIAATREMACATRIFGHDHPEFHDLSHAEWVTELMNAYENEVRK